VKPFDRSNRIDPQNTGNLFVAIISTPGFNARIVDCDSIRLGPNEARPLHCGVRDVDGDGQPDLLVAFRIPDIGLQCGDAFLFLTAQAGGGMITGQDFIRLTGCNDTATPPPSAMAAPAPEAARSRTSTASHTQVSNGQNGEERDRDR
jgi:hypothetical protein